MTLTPALDEVEARRKKEEIELCGKNRGPHDYMPIEWATKDNYKRVTRLMCRVCFQNVGMNILINHYPEIKL
jgi:hypothetical protein